jgi:methyl-accepting chemotaxis protein
MLGAFEFAGRDRTYFAIATLRGEAVPADDLSLGTQLLSAAGRSMAAIVALRELKQIPPALEAKVSAAQSAFERYVEDRTRLVSANWTSGAPMQFQAYFARSSAQLDAVVDLLYAATDDQDAFWNQRYRDRLIELSLTATFLIAGLALSALFFSIIARRVVAPVRALRSTVDRLAQGDYATAVEAHRYNDEIADITKDIERLRVGLERGQKLEMAAAAEQREKLTRQAVVESQTVAFNSSISDVLSDLSMAAIRMRDTSSDMKTVSGDAAKSASLIAVSSGETARKIEAVAASVERVATAIRAISTDGVESARIAQVASSEVGGVEHAMASVSAAAREIEGVLALIDEIAAQTNLLALNATIEAARAGEAGKGFAVVAGEVKNLSQQTARATQDIGGKIDGMRASIQAAADRVRTAQDVVKKINSVASGISSSLNEQTQVAATISEDIRFASTATQQVLEQIKSVAAALDSNGGMAVDVFGASNELAERATRVSSEIKEYIDAVANAAERRQAERRKIDVEGRLIRQDGRDIGVRVADLSPQGARLSGRLPVEKGERVRLVSDAFSGDAVVVRVGPDDVGLAFRGMRGIVEYLSSQAEGTGKVA